MHVLDGRTFMTFHVDLGVGDEVVEPLETVEGEDWQRGTMTRLTVGANPGMPVWSPEGRYLIFSRGAAGGIASIRSDGAGQAQPFTQSRNFQVSPSFTPDGKKLAYFELRGTVDQIWTAPVEEREGQLRLHSRWSLTFPPRVPRSIAFL
jgi:hypothetical protein